MNKQHIHDFCKPYTSASTERIMNVIDSVQYIVNNEIPGDLCEMGVWYGGLPMAMAMTLNELGDATRRIHLYDTFHGMTEAGPNDLDAWGKHANDQWNQVACLNSLEAVQSNMALTDYPASKISYHIGDVRKTLKGKKPKEFALLRIDLDWYELVQCALVNCYGRVASGGIVIIDDYGHWQGAKKATDEFIHGRLVELREVDYTARFWAK